MTKYAVTSLILAIGMVISSYAISKFYLKLEKEKEISVKGFSSIKVQSDIAKFYVRVLVRDKKLEDGFSKLKSQTTEIKDHIDKTIREKSMTFGNVDIDKVFKKDAKGNDTNEIDFYKLRQSVNVKSKRVQEIEKVSKELSEFISKGYEIYVDSPDYYIDDLNKYKIDLLSKATKNAHSRAMTMAEQSGGKVGKLSSAKQGVFQITSPNSTETSGYGMYDTSTIEKEIKAVVTLSYVIE